MWPSEPGGAKLPGWLLTAMGCLEGLELMNVSDSWFCRTFEGLPKNTNNTYTCIIIHYLHYTRLHYSTLDYTTLHYTTLHYITLHYVTAHHITSRRVTSDALRTHACIYHIYVYTCTAPPHLTYGFSIGLHLSMRLFQDPTSSHHGASSQASPPMLWISLAAPPG